MGNKHFLINAIVLAIASIVAKIIGAFYRIPLTNILGEQGIGLYQLAFPVFALILVLLTSGIGNAIAKLTVNYSKENNKAKVKKLLKVSLIVISVLSFLGVLILVCCSSFIANIQKQPSLKFAYLLLAPCFVFCGFATMIKSYFAGLEDLTPSSLSNITEQITKLVFGLAFASLLIKKGLIFGVLGAILGVLCSEILGLVVLLIYAIFKTKKKNKAASNLNIVGQKNEDCSYKQVIKELAKLTFPLTISGCVLPLSFVIDSLIIVKFLSLGGFTITTATENFGLLYGVVNSLVNMPVVIAVALATALMPQICIVLKESNKFLLHNNVREAINYTMFVAIFFVVIYALFSPSIINFLYKDFTNKPLARCLLSLSSISVLTLSLSQVTSAILMGLDRFWWQVGTISLACIFKIIAELSFGLTGNMSIEVLAIINILAFAIPAILNLIKIKSILKIDLILPKNKLAYTISILMMWGAFAICSKLFNNSGSLLFAIVVGGCLLVIYLIVLMLFKVIRLNFFKKNARYNI